MAETTEFNWSAGLSTAGTILSTGVNIYTSIQKGEIKAIEANMKAEQAKFSGQMADIDARVKIDQMNAQYADQAAEMAKAYEGASEDQMIQAMLQGRTMDSISSVQATDEQQYNMDKSKSLLNQQGQKQAIEGELGMNKTMTKAEMADYRASGQTAKKAGYLDAASAGLKGLTKLEQINAFDPKSYERKATDEQSSEKIMKEYNTTRKPKGSSYLLASKARMGGM